MLHSFCATVNVSLEPPTTGSDQFIISLHTSSGDCQCVRTADEFQRFHQTLTADKKLRGINLAEIPKKERLWNADNYHNYFKSILRRVVLLKHVILFLSPPSKIRAAMIALYDKLVTFKQHA